MPSAAAAIKFADDHLGSKRWISDSGIGLCQTFVADCYRAAGVSVPSVGSAYGAQSRWQSSTDLTNIPVGAAVFFSSPTTAGKKYGHVGIHAGGGMIYHHWGQIVRWSLAQMRSRNIIPLGWGWESNTVLTGGGDSSTGYDSGSSLIPSTAASQEAAAVVHIPQVEKVYTKYETDWRGKKPDRYKVTWQSVETGEIREITDRCEAPEMVDDADSLCLELSLTVRQGGADYYMPPLILVPGDFVALTNVASEEVVFVGQVQSVEGSYHSALRCRCLDGGRALTQGSVIIQFNNIPAKEAISQLANKVGIPSILCPELVSSVYGLHQQSPAEILQDILETIQAENGVRYFVRVVGTTLTVRSFGNEPIQLLCRQEANLADFDVFTEAAEPQLSWSFEEQQIPAAVGTGAAGSPAAAPDGGTGTGSTAGQPVSYLQTDPRWKGKDYSAKGERTTIGGSGCGPTAMSMVLATWADSGITPETECAWALANGFKCPGSGTYYGYFAAAAKRYGITCTQLNSGSIYGNASSGLHQQVMDALAAGDLVIACMGPGTWTRGGHYVLVWKVQGNTVYVNDPASTKPERTQGSWATFKSQVKFYWIVKRPWNVPAATTATTTTQTPAATRIVVAESFELECYGSDRAVAGALVRLDLAEVQSYFWITSVRHTYGTPHRMVLSLKRSFYEPPDEKTAETTETTGVVVSEDAGEALMEE